MQLFGDRKIRTAWNEEEEKWYFSVVDVVAVLTDSSNPSDYLKKLRSRDPELAKGWGQIVTPLPMKTPGGTQNVNCSDQEGVFRIIQSIPSPGGSVAATARKALEKQLGRSVVTKQNAKSLKSHKSPKELGK